MQVNLRRAAAMALAVASVAFARDPAQSELPAVTVCMSRSGNPTAFRAQMIASQIFARIGVRIDWPADQHSCILSRESIEIVLSDRTPAGERPGSLAYSMPYQGKTIVIFYDRLRVSATRAGEATWLGYVLAHEIAHVLQGITQHSRSGIMKPGWDGRDYAEMRRNDLLFTEEDVSLIRHGLIGRTSKASRHDASAATAAQSQ
jgi:hypothetical protein